MKLVYTAALTMTVLLGAAVAQPSTADLDFSALLRTVESAEREVSPPASGVIAFDAGADAEEIRSGDDEDNDDEVAGDADMDFSTEHIFGNALMRKSLLDRVNTLRADAGLAAVCLSYKLHNTAQSQAYYIARTNTITVISEDGFTPSHRGRSARFNSTGVAEVLAAGYTKADDTVAAWLTSADAKSILLGNYTHIGPGYAVDEAQPYVHYWVVDLARGHGENCSALVV